MSSWHVKLSIDIGHVRPATTDIGRGPSAFLGAGEAVELKFVAAKVEGAIVPHSGHWIMEENPEATTKLVTDFLRKSN